MNRDARAFAERIGRLYEYEAGSRLIRRGIMVFFAFMLMGAIVR